MIDLRDVFMWVWVVPLVVSSFSGEPVFEFSGLLTLSLFLSGVSMGMTLESYRVTRRQLR